MATYGKKYTQYVEPTHGDGRLVLNIYQKDYTGAAYEMAHLSGFSLDVQGAQSSPYAPIIKTSVSFSLVDAWDEGVTVGGIECVKDGAKCGRWEEFYTNDATKYKVEVVRDGVAIWTGFITPDSWSEDMIYRGNVTITARDMVGAMSDVEFDLSGLVTIGDIITGAFAACNAAMSWTSAAQQLLYNENGKSILQHQINAAIFGGASWYDALEQTLEALGLVMRYNGRNAFLVTSLRYMQNASGESHSSEFVNRSGFRQLDPALKQIVDTFNVELVDYIAQDPEGSRYAATGQTMTQHVVSGLMTADLPVPKYNLTLPAGAEEGWEGNLAVPQYRSNIYDSIAPRSIYFAPNITTGETARYHCPKIKGVFTLTIGQDGPMAVVDSVSFVPEPFATLKNIEVRIVRRENAKTYYYRKVDEYYQWMEGESGVVTLNIGEALDITCPYDNDDFYVEVVRLNANLFSRTLPALAALTFNFSVKDSSGLYSEYKTITNYNEANNVVIKREPKVGSADGDNLSPYHCANILSYGGKLVANRWKWQGMANGYPLGVMIAAQLLQLYADANSIFTGTLHDLEGLLDPSARYTYYGRDCIVNTARYNFVSGLVEGVNMREFLTWEHVWGSTFSPNYTEQAGSGKGSTNAGGSVSPSVGGSGSSAANLSGVWNSLDGKLDKDAFAEEFGKVMENWFAKDEDGDVFVANNKGLYSHLFVSSNGKSTTPPSGGGADLSDVWFSLKNNTGDYANQKIHVAHIPQLDASYITDLSSASVDNAAKLGGVAAASYATQSWVENKGYRAGTAPASGSWWQGTPLVNSDGVMEVGKFIDFHHANTSTADYSVRMTCPDTTGVDIALPSSNGTLALVSQVPTTFDALTSHPTTLAGYGITDANKSSVDWTAGKLTANTVELKSAAIKLITGPHGETIDDYLNVHLASSSGSWAVINGVDSYNNPLLLVSRANGYVGVGMSSPAYPLDVASSNSVCLNMTSSGAQTSMQLSRSATNLWQISHRGTGQGNELHFYHYDGTTWKQAVTLSPAGNVTASGEVTFHSDRRLKSGIEDLPFRGRLAPKTYIKDGKQSIGFIAQDVRELYPELVCGEETETTYLSLNYGGITAVLSAQLNRMEDEMDALVKKVVELEAKIKELEVK